MSRTLQFLDECSTVHRQGVELRLGRVVKDQRPLLVRDRPWEGSGDNMYPNIVRDPEDGLFKLWYGCFLDLKRHNGQLLLYAQSRDGEQWEKPELGLWEIDGSRKNNVVLPFVTGGGVALDPSAVRRDERYKLTYLVHPTLAPQWAEELMAAGFPHPIRERGAAVATSADGIHWNARPDNPVLRGIAGDTHNNWVWHAPDRKYVLFTRRNRPWRDGISRPQASWRDGQRVVIEGGSERVVKRWESDDFVHWTSGKDIFEAQGDDVGRRQYYSMPVFAWGGGYLGLLSLFNSEPDDDSVDLELAWSADTVTWRRICPGTSLVPRGPAGSVDGGCIYAGYSPLVVGDEVWLYYAGSAGTHAAGPNRHTALLRARLGRDRFAGLHAGAEGGEVVTRPLRLTGDLRINADAAHGSLVAELRRPDGQPVPGFTRRDAIPVTGDDIDASVRWRSAEAKAIPADEVQVCLQLRAATVFTLCMA